MQMIDNDADNNAVMQIMDNNADYNNAASDDNADNDATMQKATRMTLTQTMMQQCRQRHRQCCRDADDNRASSPHPHSPLI
jgi:hypothetical protein